MGKRLDNIYGVILAAGEGARLRPLSFNQPKPLLPICNKPIVQHQIEYMRDIGIKKFVIVVGHLGRHIMDEFGNGSELGVQINYVIQDKPLGIAHAVYQLEDEVDGPILLMLGDIFFVPNQLEKMLHLFEEKNAAGVIAATPESSKENVRRNFAVTLGSDGSVTRVVEKPRYVTDNLKGCGIYLFDLPIFDAIRRTPRTAMRDEYEITTSIQILIDDGYPVYPVDVVDWDMNVTIPCDLLECNLKLLKHQGLDYAIGTDVEKVNGVEIENSVVGSGAIIRNPIKISNSMVTPGTVVESTRDLDGVIVSSENVVYCSLGKNDNI